MAPTDAARRHHDAVFGERVSTLASTDPDFIEYFDNWAFDEVVADAARLDPTLDVRTRLLVQLAATLAAGGIAEFRVLASAAVTQRHVSPAELKELVYQAVPYTGMARAYDYLHLCNEILADAGVALPLGARSTSTPDTRLERGVAVQKQIVGTARVDAMHADAPDDEQHFQRYLSGNCFGDTVARDGIDLPTRELLTFAMLAALGGADNQVKGHVAGNLNVGNSRARLLAVLTLLVPFIGYPRTLNALAALDEVTRPTLEEKP